MVESKNDRLLDDKAHFEVVARMIYTNPER